jgi:hypothetical protein
MAHSDKSDTMLVGAAGEHLVLARLLARGILAAQAPRGTRKADILVNHLEDKTSCLIQVKTRSGKGADGGWHMKAKHEEIKDKDMFYCFVDLSEPHSGVYVIPAKVVAKVVTESHATWLATPGKNGRKHNDSDMRRIRNNYGMNLKSAPDGWMDKYLENWDLISG